LTKTRASDPPACRVLPPDRRRQQVPLGSTERHPHGRGRPEVTPAGSTSRKNGPHRRRPPPTAAVCGRDAVLVELPRDLGESPAACVPEADPLDDASRKRRRSTGTTSRRPTACGLTVLLQDALELVDGDEPLTPGQLDGLDRRNNPAVDGGDAHPERFGGLAAGPCNSIFGAALTASADTATWR
jgi:hypothetical protein